VRTGIAYWNSRKISDMADRDDIYATTKAINGGYTDIPHRLALKEHALKVLTA
jgi:predicted chitinase